ncbi:lytic transglycosylase domain-containing protein [Comamonadaceae bacterium OH2545_COT-014]|nr:lytic transglycosylase domain-containing protein [Comamonadaceae bacterium OH2545_COT-014]
MYEISIQLLKRQSQPRFWRGLAALVVGLTAASAYAAAAGVLGSAAGSAKKGGCGSGWDQFVPLEQRAAVAQARGCAEPKPARAAAPALARQVAVYERHLVDGPFGALEKPAGRVGRKNRLQRPRRAQASNHYLPSASFAPARTSRGGAAAAVALAPLIDSAARSHNIDPLLLHAIARVESRHNTRAISHAGAHGLMQVIVPTAARFGVGNARALHDPQTNLHVSARYLKTLQARFGNQLPLVLAAYNAGEGAVERYGRRIPPYRETQGYVRQVLAEYALLRRKSATGGAL